MQLGLSTRDLPAMIVCAFAASTGCNGAASVDTGSDDASDSAPPNCSFSVTPSTGTTSDTFVFTGRGYSHVTSVFYAIYPGGGRTPLEYGALPVDAGMFTHSFSGSHGPGIYGLRIEDAPTYRCTVGTTFTIQ